jgi:hypothetical protein
MTLLASIATSPNGDRAHRSAVSGRAAMSLTTKDEV